jgi:ferritin
MIVDLELKAQKTIAAACVHIANQNNADAVRLVNWFLQETTDDGMDAQLAMESLTRAGIAISLMAAEPNPVEVFDRIIGELAMSEEV